MQCSPDAKRKNGPREAGRFHIWLRGQDLTVSVPLRQLRLLAGP
jgi:hypothetical protein